MKKILSLIPILCIGLVAWGIIQQLRSHTPIPAYGSRLPQIGSPQQMSEYSYSYHGVRHHFNFLTEPVGMKLTVVPDKVDGTEKVDLTQPGDFRSDKVIVVIARND